ncbi:MAG TPA: CHRD domain-containing protein, partial [Opitutaceae bacterium]|nr:CHRD domain-containing protein [Opitutaceae bacterium]
MNAPLGRLIVAALLAAVVTSIRAQVIEFHATLSPDQETSTVNSPASGSALLLYDVTSNTFDLYVTLNNFAAPLTAS